MEDRHTSAYAGQGGDTPYNIRGVRWAIVIHQPVGGWVGTHMIHQPVKIIIHQHVGLVGDHHTSTLGVRRGHWGFGGDTSYTNLLGVV